MFVTNKVLEKFHDALLACDNILFFDKDLSKVTCFANEVGILVVDLDKINLDDADNFDEMILKLLFMSEFWLGVINLKNVNHLKKIKANN